MQEKSVKEILAENIKNLREAAGLKKAEFARKINVTKSLITKYEKGENFFPIEKLPAVVKTLNCTANDLFSPLFDKFKDDEDLTILINRLKEMRSDIRIKEAMKEFTSIVNTYLERTIPPEEGDAELQANG